MVDVYCPHCNEELEIIAKSGDTVQCAECERPFVVTNQMVSYYKKANPSMAGKFVTKTAKVVGGIIFIIIAMSFVAIVKVNVLDTNSSPTQTRDEKVKALFSSWDGSNKELVNYVKSNMKDPDSFEHVETRIRDKKGVVTAQMVYRGKNSFGATMTERVVADIDPATKQISNFKKLD